MGLILQDTARFDMYIHTLLLYMAIDSVAYHVSQFVAASLHGLVHTFPKLIIHWAWHFLTLLDLIFIYIIMQLLHGYDVLYTPYRKNLIATLSDPYIFTVDQSYLIHHGLCTTNANNPLGLTLHDTTRFNQYIHVQLLYGYGFVAHHVS